MKTIILMLIWLGFACLGNAQTSKDNLNLKLGVYSGPTVSASNSPYSSIMDRILFSGGLHVSGELRKPDAKFGIESGLGYHLYRSQSFNFLFIESRIDPTLLPFNNVILPFESRLHVINLPLLINFYKNELIFQTGCKINYLVSAEHLFTTGFGATAHKSKENVRSMYSAINPSFFISVRQRFPVGKNVLEIGPALESYITPIISREWEQEYPMHASLNLTWQF
jgi:hypothetical protein